MIPEDFGPITESNKGPPCRLLYYPTKAAAIIFLIHI